MREGDGGEGDSVARQGGELWIGFVTTRYYWY